MPFNKNRLKLIMRIILIIIVLVILITIIRPIYEKSYISQRMINLITEATSGVRHDMYVTGAELWGKHPFLGIGLQGYAYYYGRYSHSTLVEIPVSGGLLGSFIYFLVYLVSIRKTILLIKITNKIENMKKENIQLRMILILWIMVLFYSTCIIHAYQFESFIVFAIIFSITSIIETKIKTFSKFNRNV